MTLRAAGNMKSDAQARRRVLAELGLESSAIARVTQTHSRRVVVLPTRSEVQRTGEYSAGEADGIVSGPGGPYLAVTVADCVPLFCYDTGSGAYAILHSGWKGTGILAEAVGVMRDQYSTDPGNLIVLAGPGIHANSYEVDAKRAEVFREWGDDAVVRRGDSCFLDLYAANRGIANGAGIGTFTEVTNCTAAEPVFGSYRREGADSYTSMLAILGPARNVQ
jgi:YfiH family protein